MHLWKRLQAEIEAGNLNEFIKLEVTQSANLPKERSTPLSAYLLAGSSGFLFLCVRSSVVLFINTVKTNK
jgi:hypothetical protein